MDFNKEFPIYIQIAKYLEENIFTGIYKEGEQIPSTTEISVGYNLNPATVLKGMNILVQEEILFKKRGVGMFVSEGAREKIVNKRLALFKEDYVIPLIHEAKNLGFNEKEIIGVVEEEIEHEITDK